MPLLSSQLASSRSQNRTLIHQAVSLHACHLRPQTCLPSTEKSKEKEQVGKTSPTLALDCKHANHVCQIHLNFQLGWEHHIFTKHYTNKESQQLEETSGWSINSVLTNLCKLSREKTPLPLYCLALCNRHSWWGRWHRRRICHNFVAEAATVTIGTSALQNVTANGPADRRSKHSLWSQS